MKIKTGFQDIKCGFPQGSILSPLLFIIFINDLYRVYNFLQPVVFAHDTNLFFLMKTSRICLEQLMLELQKINIRFRAKKISLNEDKTKYTLFHTAGKWDDISLELPTLFINKKEVKRVNSIKVLGIMLYETFRGTKWTYNNYWKQTIKKHRNHV